MVDYLESFTIKPIGYFHASQTKKYSVPRQATVLTDYDGVIKLNPHSHFEQALEGLEGFDRIWILFRFHLHGHWKPKVLPPRGGKKQGVFATRSPHRPNLIGLSCVELKKIQGLSLYVANHDLVDGTPIVDIKPYLNYADSFQCAHQGWLDELPTEENITVYWSDLVDRQLSYLANEWNCQLKEEIAMRLKTSHLPYANNRVKCIQNNHYQLAYQTWRVNYLVEEGKLLVQSLFSGYDDDTLAGRKSSKWEDVAIHQAFCLQFPTENTI